MGSLLLLLLLSALAGLISLLILVGKVVLRMVNGPEPVDPSPPPELRRAVPHSVVDAILVVLVLLGACSAGALYVIGGALAVR